MIGKLLSNMLAGDLVHGFRREIAKSARIFDKVVGYGGIKRALSSDL
jgi:hypothetical protein